MITASTTTRRANFRIVFTVGTLAPDDHDRPLCRCLALSRVATRRAQTASWSGREQPGRGALVDDAGPDRPPGSTPFVASSDHSPRGGCRTGHRAPRRDIPGGALRVRAA